MARLEIELAGVNKDLKRVLKESKIELNNFSKGLDFKNTGVSKLNASLAKTKSLLTDISKLARQAQSSLGGQVNVTALNQERLATQQARTETQNYRTEQARLASQLADTRLQTAQNRTATTAAAGSYREAQQTLTALGQSIRNAENGFRSTDPAIRNQIRQYRELNTRLREFDATMGNHQRNVGNYASALRGLGGLVTTYFGFSALLAAGRAVLKNNIEISDSLADVRRTAGLTAKEAENLGKSLKGIDTRTSLKDLLGISVIGGQLGIAKDQLSGFTKAVDELAVTLGGELKGGAEGIAKSLGVLDNVFGVTTSNAGDVEKSYNQIGSAILGLGQSGLATGDFLADFGERVGGVAKQAGLSLPVILSYGAVLQENGVTAEVAGSSFKRLISALATRSGQFFQVAKFADANLTLKEFNTLINTDTKRALDLFFKGINKGGSSTIAFNTILKSLKIAGAGASQSVSAIANNLDDLDKHVKDSQKDFDNASLSAEQFAIKNNNLAASVDKLGNAFTNITTNPDSNIGKFFKYILDSVTDTINGIDDLTRKISKIDDDFIIKGVRRGSTNLTDVQKGAIDRRISSNKAGLADDIRGRGTSRGQQIAGGTSSEIELTKKLSGERKRLIDVTNRLNYTEAFIRDPKNTGPALDAQIAKVNKLRVAYAEQTFVVGTLQKQLAKLYPKNTPKSNADAPDLGTGKDKKGFSLSDTLKELRDDLVKADLQFGATFDQKNEDKIKAYQKAIDSVAVALGKNNSATLKLISSQRDLFQLPEATSMQATGATLSDKLTKKIDKEFKAKIKVDTSTVDPGSLFNKDNQQAFKRLTSEDRRFNDMLSYAVTGFGQDFIGVLRGINSEADRTFGAIVGNLAGSLNTQLNTVFATQFSDTLKDLLAGIKVSIGDIARSAVGLAGSLVSGISKKTSSGGQALGGALTGAAAGAALGPIGAAAGAVIGAIGGLFGAKKARKEEALRQAELAEQKKQTKLLERQNALAYAASIIGRQTTNGIVTGVDVNEFGQVITKVSGNDLLIIHDRAVKSRQRGT